MIKQSIKLVWYLAAFTIVSFALMITLMRFLTPELAAKREKFQEIASNLLQRPVQIGAVHAEMQWFSPVLVFDDVALFENNRKHILLKVSHVAVSINLLNSLMHWQIRPGAIVIDGAQVIVQHQANGQWLIAGIDAMANVDPLATDNALLDWPLSQKEIVLKHVAIQWYTKDHKILPLTNVAVNLDNEGDQHQFRGQFRLRQAQASTFKIIGNLQGSAKKIADWSGSLYLATDNLILQQWLPEFSWSPANIKSGIISGRFWLSLRGSQISKVKSQVAVKALAVDVKTEKATIPMVIDSAKAELLWQQLANGWTLSGDHVQMQYQKQQWPENNFKIDFQKKNDENLIAARCHYLHLNAFQPILTQLHLPLPQGDLRDVSMRMPSKSQPWMITGAAINVGMTAYDNLPAFTGLDADFKLSQINGELKLNSKKLQIAASKWTPHPIEFALAQGDFHYQHVADNWQVTAKSLALKQDPLIELRGGFNWRKTKEHPEGVVDAIAGFSVHQAHDLFNYVPQNILNPGLKTWLESAMTTQGAVSGKVVMRSDINLFDLQLNLRDTALKFHPAWPALEHTNGSVHIHNNRLDAVVNHAKIGKVLFDHADIVLNDLQSAHKMLLIKGHTHTQLNDALPTLHGSPIAESLAPLNALQATGPFDLDIDLQIPLHYAAKPVIAGTVELEGAVLHIPTAPIVLQKVAGKVRFTSEVLHAEDLVGWWDDQPLHATITTRAHGTLQAATQVEVDSSVNKANLTKLINSTWFDQLSGKTQVHASVTIPHAKSAPILLALNSNLVGLYSNLPAPFNKVSRDAAQFEMQSEFSAHQQIIHAKLQNGNRGAVRYNSSQTGWQLDLDSPEVKGLIQALDTENKVVKAHMTRLYYQPQENGHSALNPKTLPAFDLQIDDFHYGTKQFGKLELKTSKTTNGLTIDNFALTSTPFELAAKGSWEQHGQHSLSSLRGEATSHNLADTLTMWDIPPAVEAKRGYYRFDFSVPKPLTEASLTDLSGQLHIQLNEGRITKLNADTENKLGLGKLLSILSLQSLPSHLLQGFSDVSQTGFPYNTFSGDFIFEQGQAKTNNAELDGPIAYAKLNGIIGFNNKNYHMKIRVSPHLEETLPLVATIAGGPLAGAATWVATHVMSNGLRAVNYYDYALEGQWNAPTVKVG